MFRHTYTYVGVIIIKHRSTVLKTPISESRSPLKPVAGYVGSFLTFLTVVMLGVRTFTAGPDTRYIDSFPTAM